MTNPVDQAIHDWVVDHRTAWLTDVVWKVSDVGSTVVVAVGVLMIGTALSVRARSFVPVAAAALGELAVELAARAVKAIVGRPRPPYDDAIEHLANSSLPSAHVARATVLVSLAVFLVPARWRRAALAIAIVVVVAVAYARVYLGSHWFTDTLVAWPFGLAAVLGAQKVTGGAFSTSTVGNGHPADTSPVS